MKNLTKNVGLIIVAVAALFTTYTLFQFLDMKSSSTFMEAFRAASLPIYGGIAILIGLALYAIGLIEDK